MADLQAELQSVQDQLAHYTNLKDAMDCRLELKDQEIENLRERLETLRTKFSLLSHSMAAGKSPLFTDPNVNDLLLQMRSKLRHKQERLNLVQASSNEFIGKNFARVRDQQERWQKMSEQNLKLSEEFAESQDLLGELQRMSMTELKVRLTESQELIAGLETESGALLDLRKSLLQRYTQAKEQLRVLKGS
mmetsp:Transcript_12735/g.23730  ORF Transcript_12735/g.23730 Transcript_12735/m.23730 type:complete len:191 (-) Transcript_12735:23-595(-)